MSQTKGILLFACDFMSFVARKMLAEFFKIRRVVEYGTELSSMKTGRMRRKYSEECDPLPL
jgi:hypothetical protein